MSRLVKIILYSVGGWIAALALLSISGFPGFGQLLNFLACSALLITALVAVVTGKDKALPTLALLLVAVTGWLMITKSLDWGARIHFQINRGKYEAKLADVLSISGEADRKKACADQCLILSNDPTRISFHYYNGLLNSYDFVYDPTGEIMAPDWDTKKRLNTYLRGAKHLSGDWYFVHFGD